MKDSIFKADLLLLLVAVIWGFSFVAQRTAMEDLGPFTFNGLRFSLAVLFLIPIYLILRNRKNNTLITVKPIIQIQKQYHKLIITGFVLFIAANLQQMGIVYTTAGKAGFITGLYVVIVPFLGIFIKQKTNLGNWIGASFAVIGLYLLSIRKGFSLGWGDLLVLFGAFLWALHVLLIGSLSKKLDALLIAIFQFSITAFLSLLIGVISEPLSFKAIIGAGIPILYGGLMSVGIAYTLQIVAQKNTHPSHAAIILSMESLFSVIGGYLLLRESLSLKELTGCLLMFVGMIISQMFKYWKYYKNNKSV